MKNLFVFCLMFLSACSISKQTVPESYDEVNQVLWVVDDLENVMTHWESLGFTGIVNLDTVLAKSMSTGKVIPIRMAKANLGGAHITWIQPLEEQSVFALFHKDYGDGAMSLVHRLKGKVALKSELTRLGDLGIGILEEISIETPRDSTNYVLMDTRQEGKYILGYIWAKNGDPYFTDIDGDNAHRMKINQYAFAIRDPEPVSEFWARLGQPEFQINYPELGNMHYYGEPTDHELIQGWQRHGTVAYEWCIPVKPPIVYDDHIRKHGEGIHHLAFTVQDMDQVLNDYKSKGYVNSMGGTWGEEGKPGSGRYEYIDLENAGGVTMELLWSYPSQD